MSQDGMNLSLRERFAAVEVLTLDEAAAILRMAPSTAKKHAREGTFPGLLPRLGSGKWLVSKDPFFDWVENRNGGERNGSR